MASTATVSPTSSRTTAARRRWFRQTTTTPSRSRSWSRSSRTTTASSTSRRWFTAKRRQGRSTTSGPRSTSSMRPTRRSSPSSTPSRRSAASGCRQDGSTSVSAPLRSASARRRGSLPPRSATARGRRWRSGTRIRCTQFPPVARHCRGFPYTHLTTEVVALDAALGLLVEEGLDAVRGSDTGRPRRGVASAARNWGWSRTRPRSEARRR